MSQSGISGSYTSALDVFRKMYRNEGITSFYSGLTPALLGVAHLAIQFPLYEQLKRSFTGTGIGGWSEEGNKSEVPGILLASSLSKICAGAATYPHEVLRTRLQTQRRVRSDISSEKGQKNVSHFDQSRAGSSSDAVRPQRKVFPRYWGIVDTSRTILREEGWRALYAGMGTSMIRAIPAATTTMLVYEGMAHILKKTRASGGKKLALRNREDEPDSI